MKKNNILIISTIYLLILVLLAIWDGCYDLLWCRDYINPIVSLLVPLLVIFPFSLITYKMRDEVFLAWRNFSYWWIPLSILLVLVTPEGNSVIMSWGKEIPAIGMSALYAIISTIIIFRIWWKGRSAEKPTS